MTRIKTSLSEIRQLERAYELTIPQDFLDENSHVNVQYYLHLVERGLAKIFERVGLGEVYAAADTYGNFALEQHIRYFAEILLDERVSVYIRLVDLSAKRAYFMGFLVNETREQFSASVEVVMMNVDMTERLGAAFPADSYRELETMLRRHQELKWTAPICGVMGV